MSVRATGAQAIAAMIAASSAEARAEGWHFEEADVERARTQALQLAGIQPLVITSSPTGAAVGGLLRSASGALIGAGAWAAFGALGLRLETPPNDLSLKVGVALALDGLDAEDVEIEASRGIVVVRGVVPTVKERIKSEKRIWDVPGVTDLTNALRVRQKTQN
jgi:hypothetical protein